jgi:tight adherence protein B
MAEYGPYIMVACLTAALVLSASFGIRQRLDRRRQARVDQRLLGPSGESLLGDLSIQPAPTGWAARMDLAFTRLMHHSGLKATGGQILAIMLLLGVTLGLLFFVLRDDFLLAALGLILGVGIPLAVLLVLQARWRRRLQDQLPSAFDLMARSTRAGLSLEQSLAMVGEQGPQPLAEEFRRCSDQISLGLTAPVALQSSAQRMQLTDFDMLVSLVMLYRTTGGNLALLLDRLAASTRDRNQFRGYFRTATTLSKVTAVCIGGAIPALLLYYLLAQPDYIGNFFRSSVGLTTVAISLGLEVIGAVWLYLLLRVDY